MRHEIAALLILRSSDRSSAELGGQPERPTKGHIPMRSGKRRANVRSPRWNRLRRIALDRADWRCEGCGVAAGSGGLEVHHVKPLQFGGSNELSNLRVLCVPCHLREHKRLSNPDRLEWERRLGL